MTIERESIQRANIAQAVHGLSGTAVLRGAAWWLGDLYLYILDAGVASFKKVALNGTANEYEVLNVDYEDWSHPFDMGTSFTEAAHAGNFRYYPGLHIAENRAYLFTPKDDASGYSVMHLAPLDALQPAKTYDLEWAEEAEDYESSQEYDLYGVPYETINGAHVGMKYNEIMMQVGRKTTEESDVVAGPFTKAFANMLVASVSPKLTMHRNFRLEFTDEELSSGSPVGIIKAFDDYIALYYDGTVDMAMKIRAVHDMFPATESGVAPREDFYAKHMSSAEWFLGGADKWLLSYSYNDEQDRYFYGLKFDDATNDLEIWAYQDKATRCSSALSHVELSTSKIKFGHYSPVQVNVDFIDAFGDSVPEGEPVLFRVKDVANPEMGGISLYEPGPFFDPNDDPINEYVWCTVDSASSARAYFLSPRNQVTDYTEVIEIVAGFDIYDGLFFEAP